MKRFGTKAWILLAVVAVAVVAAVGGYAYWTAGGSGTGSATTGDVSAVVVHQTSTVSNLYPGGPAVPLAGNFDNPNSGAVYVGSVSASVAGTSNGGCTAADFAVEGTSNTPGEIPSGNGVGSWSGLTLRMVDSGSNQNACKNVTVDLSYSAS
jgi:hypothetical protein